MKFILTISISILCYYGSSAQILQDNSKEERKYEVRLVYYFLCEDTIANVNDFSLNSLNTGSQLLKDYAVYIAMEGVCTVPRPGSYKVNGIIDNLEENVIHVDARKIIDTITIYKIYLAGRNGIPSWPYFSCCGGECDGYQIDYWKNGNKRIEGEFKNGRALEFVKYNRNGIIIQKVINRKYYKLYEIYDNDELKLKYWKFLFFKGGKVWDDEKGKYYKSY